MPQIHPFLRVEKVDALPLRLRLIAKRALRPERTAQDVDDACEVTENHTIFEQSCFCPVFYTVLGSHVPSPNELGPERMGSILQALKALKALLFIVNGLNLPVIPNRDFYTSVWERAWPWIHFFTHFDNLTERLSIIQSKASFLQCFLASTGRFVQATETCGSLLNTPGFRTFVAAAWSSTVLTDGAPPAIDDKYLLAVLAHLALGHLLRPSSFPEQDGIQEIIDGVGGTIDDLAQVLTAHLRMVVSIKVTSRELLHMKNILRLLCLADGTKMHSSSVSPLLRTAVHMGFMEHLVDATYDFALNMPPMDHLPPIDQRVVVQTLIDSLDFLARVFMFADLYPAYDKTLAARILRNMTLCARHLAGEPAIQTAMDGILRALMPAVLLDYYAMQHLADEFARYKELLKENSWQASDTWIEFAAVAADRLALLSALDTSSMSKACDNIQCGLITHKNRFKRCSQCKDAYYCSSNCQVADWQGGHRKVCDKRRSLGLARHGFHQRCYIQALMQQDYERHKSFIYGKYFDLMLANPELNSARFCTCFDYSTLQVHVTVQTSGLDSIRNDKAVDEWTLAACDDALSRACTTERYRLHTLSPPLPLLYDGWSDILVVPLRSAGSSIREIFAEIAGTGFKLEPDEAEMRRIFVERALKENANVLEIHQ
ncbi:hypothetical protein C8F01DRAFT_1368496 [Mycena amicta]|nr:hypothetical protein C8F01DRAFT_1368496 [Mycena amicta]